MCVCIRSSVRVVLVSPYLWGHPKPEFITIYVINYSRRVHGAHIHTAHVWWPGRLDDDACWRGANPVDVARICSSQIPSHSSSLNTHTHAYTDTPVPVTLSICHPHINACVSADRERGGVVVVGLMMLR